MAKSKKNIFSKMNQLKTQEINFVMVAKSRNKEEVGGHNTQQSNGEANKFLRWRRRLTWSFPKVDKLAAVPYISGMGSMYWSDCFVGRRNRFYSIGVFWMHLIIVCAVVVVNCRWWSVVVVVSCCVCGTQLWYGLQPCDIVFGNVLGYNN